MASPASRIGAMALRSTARIRPRCTHLRSPLVRTNAFHSSPARRADNEDSKNGDRSPHLPNAAPETEADEPSGDEELFPEARTSISGAEMAAKAKAAAAGRTSKTPEASQPPQTSNEAAATTEADATTTTLAKAMKTKPSSLPKTSKPAQSKEPSFDDGVPLTAEEKAAADAFIESPPEEYRELLERVKTQVNAMGSSILQEWEENNDARQAFVDAEKEFPMPALSTPARGEKLPKEPYEGDDITSLAHLELDQHRDMREYMRIIAWEMPKLMKLSRPFEPPSADRPLRFRYTTYMGETHPAENKVVLEFCTADLPIKPAERLKLVKLVGRRYDPQTDLVKMSCESFSSQAQNKRYLGDLVGTLMQVAKGKGGTPEAKDSFADVPVDFRHVKWKNPPKFPEAWKMTPARRQLLRERRAQIAATENQRVQQGSVVDGIKLIRESYAVRRPSPAQERAGASLQGRVDRITADAKGRVRPTVRI